MLGIKEIALLVTAVAAVALGIAVYQRTPDRVWNRLFAVHATGGGLWVLLNYLLTVADTPYEASLYLRLTHPVVAMVICTAVDFAWVFPERIEYAAPKLRVGLYFLGALMGTVAFAPNLYHSITIEPGGIVNVIYGTAFPPFGIFTLLALGYADLVLLRKALRLEGVQRVQVIWVLIGLAGSHLVAGVTIIIIPLVWGTTAYSGWGASGYIITLAGMSYAIAKHHLMRPEMALRRLASALVSAGLVLVLGVAALRTARPALAAHGVPANVGYVSVGVLMGVLIFVLHRQVSSFLQRTSSGGDPVAVQAEISTHILRTLDADQLLGYLARALASALDPSSVVVYTREREGGDLVLRTVVGAHAPATRAAWRPAPIPVGSRVLEVVSEESAPVTRDQIFRFAALADARELARVMEQMDAHVIAPLVWEDELIGLVTLGPKLSGDMYSDEDLRFVADMALQASLGLRNAELYAQTAALMEFNERILQQMDNAVVVTAPEEQIVVFNEAAERLFALKAEEVIGHGIDLLPPGVAECIRSSLVTGRTFPARQVEFRRGDRTVPVVVSASPLAGDGERSQGVVAVIGDLTLIQELQRERAEAERLSLIRVISAGMAHEIRNPLVAIRTFAELAPRRLDDPDFRSSFLLVAQQEIGRIDKLVTDLMTLSKPADAVNEAVDINGLCRLVVRATAGLAEARDLHVQVVTSAPQHTVMGDSTRLYQALLNLMTNAIDAEPEGGTVRLATEITQGERGGDVIRVVVHNSGSYIPPEEWENIFRPFVSRKPQGTGLGLAICQTIIEEHAGRIRVRSDPEQGTDFVVELPLSGQGAVMATTAGDC